MKSTKTKPLLNNLTTITSIPEMRGIVLLKIGSFIPHLRDLHKPAAIIVTVWCHDMKNASAHLFS